MTDKGEDTEDVPEGTPGHLPADAYDPPADWLREAMEGPFPRDEYGRPMTYDAETGEWVTQNVR
jgi:hypothetical protein